MSKDESPAAFPLGANEYGGHGSQAGMTLRDYFAAKAMQAWLSTYGSDDRHPSMNNSMDRVAVQAYQLADAMLAARNA